MPTKYPGTTAEKRALNAYIALQRAADSLSARLLSGLSAAKLTESQFGVLEALYHLGPMCQRDIARKILTTKANMTLVIDNLEKRALVQRTRSKADRRYFEIALTTAGRKLIEEFLPEHVDAICRQFDILNAEEQELLRKISRTLGKQSRE